MGSLHEDDKAECRETLPFTSQYSAALLSDELWVMVFVALAPCPKTLVQFMFASRRFYSILHDNRIWYEVFLAYNKKLGTQAFGMKIAFRDWPLPWRALMRDQLQFQRRWTVPQKGSTPFIHGKGKCQKVVGCYKADFDTLTFNFVFGPKDRMVSYKWAVQDIPDPSTGDGTLAVLSEWNRETGITAQNDIFYALHIFQLPTWDVLTTHCINTKHHEYNHIDIPDDPPVVEFGDDRFLKLLHVNHARGLVVFCDWDFGDRCALWVRHFRQNAKEIYQNPFMFTSSLNSQELIRRPDGSYVLFYLEPQQHNLAIQPLSSDFVPGKMVQLPTTVSHFHYDPALPDYVLTSTANGCVVLWRLADYTAVTSFQISDRPVELTIFRFWNRPYMLGNAPAPPSRTNKATIPQVLSVSMVDEAQEVEWDPSLPNVINLCALPPSTFTPGEPLSPKSQNDNRDGQFSPSQAQGAQLNGDENDGAVAAAAPVEFPTMPAPTPLDSDNVHFTSDNLVFLACFVGYNLFFGLDDKGNVNATDLITGEGHGPIITVHRSTNDTIMKGTGFTKTARKATVPAFTTRAPLRVRDTQPWSLTEKPAPTEAIVLTHRVSRATMIIEPPNSQPVSPAAPSATAGPSAPSASSVTSNMSTEVPTFSIHPDEDHSQVASSYNNPRVIPPPKPQVTSIQSDDDEDDEESDPFSQGVPYGDLMWVGNNWDTLLVYRGRMMCILTTAGCK